jgi:hypothetical protein
MFRKKAVIESVNDKLKNICRIEHTPDTDVLPALSPISLQDF